MLFIFCIIFMSSYFNFIFISLSICFISSISAFFTMSI
nr:MAG TPA: hypothetical protein [Bacteriophage sp.]